MSWPVYWRVQMGDDGLNVCCLQGFDERDYDESRWITPEKFDTEEAAREYASRVEVWVLNRIINRLGR